MILRNEKYKKQRASVSEELWMDVNSQRLSYRLSQLASWNSDALLSKCILSLSVEKKTPQ